MSEVETTTQPILKQMLRGEAVTLSVEDQCALRTWIVLRGMILERGASEPNARHFYTDQERRHFADVAYDGALEPLDGSYIWLFEYRTRRWAARSNVANINLDLEEGSFHFQGITGYVGRFGFQILLGRWPAGVTLALQAAKYREWEDATVLLWPANDQPIGWPPRYCLHDAVYDSLLDRLTKGTLVQRRRR
ncbi:MAG TPA: hypothetical protein VI485_21535 [Vicinamibacterales bacterium]|nr:hypothetical protein [Vicinamibacterales bacterium]